MGITQQSAAARLIQPGVCTSSTRPVSPFEGQAIFETDTDRMLIWNGTAWVIPNAPAQNPTGLELVKTQTVGSGVSSIVVENAFLAEYDNYKITYTGGVGSTSIVLGLQFGVGTTMTATNYFGTAAYTNLGAGAWQIITDNPGTSATNVGGANSTNALLATEVLQPFLTKQTSFFGQYNVSDFGRLGIHSYAQLSNTSFTSFRIATNTGTVTGGTIRVYGYRNS